MGVRIELLSKESLDSNKEIVTRIPIRVYSIDADLTEAELDAAKKLLIDPITDEFAINKSVLGTYVTNFGEASVIEVTPKPGVTDPHGQQVSKVLEELIGRKVDISFSEQYLRKGHLNDEEFKILRKRLGHANPVINDYRVLKIDRDWNPSKHFEFEFPTVKVEDTPLFQYIDLDVSDENLMKISDDRYVAMNLSEMKTIQKLFQGNLKGYEDFLERRKAVGLDAMPTDVEIEELGQTWSEHCKHKKLNGLWYYTSDDSNDESGLPEVVDSLFKTIIAGTTYKIAENVDYLVSIFKDNSGVVRLNDKWNIAHKVETHNHPSSIDGFGGANTGSGGVFRDPNMTGLGMIVVSSQYAFRFALPEDFPNLPDDVQDPRRTLETVVWGVEDYGNKMGIPTQYGDLMFDRGWLKGAVYVGAVAVQKKVVAGKQTHEKTVKSGYIGISLGGGVGKDGIHGATGSSESLDVDAEKRDDVNQSVQIGNPIVEKEVFEVEQILLELGYIEAAQDCGAGGWNSAIGELSELSGGGKLILTHVPEKYQGLMSWEKTISESQERNVLVIKPEHLDKIIDICTHYGVSATKIAEFTDDGYYQIIDHDKTVAFLPMEFRTQGLPQMEIKAHWTPPEVYEPELPELADLTQTALDLLSRPNVQSFNWVSTRYDHEVRGGSFLKPLAGPGKGKNNAIAYRPVQTEKEIAIESGGSNPWQGDIDSYHQGRNGVVDAIGRTVAAGGNLDQISFNGNLTCPKPEKDEYIAAKVERLIKGASDAELEFLTPRTSGKDSTSLERKIRNSITGEVETVKAKPELMMSSLCVMPDESTITSTDFKLAGDLIYLVGDTRDELGGSEYYLMKGEIGANVPKSDFDELNPRYQSVVDAVKSGVVHSAQYLAKGGLWAGLANSAIGGQLGANVGLDNIDEDLGRADNIAFSETTGRMLVSVHPSNKDAFENIMGNTYARQIGVVTEEQDVKVLYKRHAVIETDVNTMNFMNQGEIRH